MTTPLDQIKNKFLASVVEGVQHFPVPPPELGQPLSSCQACVLSEQRKRVVVAKSFAHKKFFVLSDFPDKEDEAADDVFSKDSAASALIVKLLEKLGIIEQSHFAFALKCNPERGIPEQSLSLCVQKNLFLELRAVSPQMILCFGSRASSALSLLDISSEKLKSQVFSFPSSRELRDFPYWRIQVWQTLSSLLRI